jgi:hypothetical protein
MGSAIYADWLDRCAADYAAGGLVARVVEGWDGHPVLDNLPLRLLGAAHYLALLGDAPELARYLPSAGGHFESEPAWRALRDTLEFHSPRIRSQLRDQIQTNEVRRCCALLGGFLEIARVHRLPLRLLEIGSSAGLALCFDRYRYELGALQWGPRDAEVALDCEWRGTPLDARHADLKVASRAGCDLAPVDLSSRESCLRLESFFWPDQGERLARLRAACRTAQRAGVRVERASAADWIARELAEPRADTVSVLFHSVMWLYVPERDRGRIRELVATAGERASPEAPLAWLRLEGPNFDYCELRLLTWPGAEERLLARAHYHGAWVEWLSDRSRPGEVSAA